MKRIFVRSVFAVLMAVVFLGLVHGVLWMAHVSQPAATTVQGTTSARWWASAAMVIALFGAIVGGLALARRAGRFETAWARRAAMIVGVVGAVNGALVVGVANAGPGSGNGVVGGAAALVLGLAALAFGGLAAASARAAKQINRSESHRPLESARGRRGE